MKYQNYEEPKEIKSFIEEHIPQMDSPEKVYQLFEGLGYRVLDPSYRGKEAWALREKDSEGIEDIYTIANYNKRFQIFLVKLKHFSSSIIRELPLYFERETQYPFFVLTPDYRNYTFVLVEKIREAVGIWKRKLIKLNVNRESAFYTDKLILTTIALEEAFTDPSKIYRILREALSVEKVSRLFFEDYKNAFFKIRNFLLKQKIHMKGAHEFSQQLLNRIMFIYFIDKKRWLKNSPKFMKWFWDRYNEEKKSKTQNEFYPKWLLVLFLEAFNNRFSHPHYLPKDVRDALALAPYLNGGLFKRNELDNLPVSLPDDFIESILKFFEKYNFTIREDLPLDVEVAVDPQMIGYVYESLANVAEEIYERQDLGIFYTPKIEVDFMCRRSLLEYLFKSTGIKKENLYKLLFDEEKENIEKLLNFNNYEQLEEALDNLSVVDPACGSGAFLVGMLNVLVELYRFIYRRLKRDMTDYQLKKRIIGNSLYGVDVMPWAVHSAELRLWLSLMIESDLALGDLKLFPLLPNLNLKLRVGDSLVQEIGGVNLNLRERTISPSLKRKLSELKREKEKYYNNDPTAKFKSEEGMIYEELRIFHNILDERISDLFREKQLLTIKPHLQPELFKTEKSQDGLFDEKKLQEQVENKKRKIDAEIEKLQEVKRKLKEQKPFIWDIDFAEVFGEKGGFDIVIGNPPYVRQEKIAPPNKLKSEVSNEEKREYKDKLLKSVKAQFPIINRIDKKSDYYVYFYFHGLSLLNKRGTFCFITSNSWLDVGYGKDLQQFLLKYVPIMSIYDNQAKRSFEHADVNTIIALFGAPYNTRKTGPALQNTAKFVMFKKPFEQVVNTENLLSIEKAQNVLTNDDLRVYPKAQHQLLEEGWEHPEEAPEEQRKAFQFNIGKYAGNKWGGKYLRAPDIYFKILEKGKGKLVRLGDIAEVRFGIKTGCNEFFYLPSKHFDIKKEGRYYRLIPKHEGLPDDLMIEEEFLRPVIISPREVNTYFFKAKDLSNFILFCPSNDCLISNGVNRYIQFGLRKGFHKRSTLMARNPWWQIKEHRNSTLIWAMIHAKRHNVHYNIDKCEVDHNFFEIITEDKTSNDILAAQSISSMLIFMKELFGRAYGGGSGPIKNEGIDIRQYLFILPEKIAEQTIRNLFEQFDKLGRREIMDIFNELGISPYKNIRSQKPRPLPDRKALDDLVFDILGLTQSEKDEVYWSICELVKNRLEKARSV